MISEDAVGVWQIDGKSVIAGARESGEWLVVDGMGTLDLDDVR